MVQRAYEKVKRVREEAQAAIKREEALRRKKKRSGNHSSSGHFASVKKAPCANGVGNDDFWIVDEKKGVSSIDSSSGHFASVKRTPGANSVGNDDFWIVDEKKGVSSIDSRTQLLERARCEIKKKLHQWSSGTVWSPEWNDETSNEVKHKYEIVEVDESDEDTGFTVTPLVKVAGFKTVFRRNLNPKEARVFPESEICRFSHQIPSHFLTGRGSLNAIKGCLDLDPAAIPDEFLQVIAVVQDLENIDDDDDDDPIVKDSGLTSNNEPQVLADVNEQFISINTSLTAIDS
ncbi:DnaJ domain-containing protein [Tanacetum coccineum]